MFVLSVTGIKDRALGRRATVRPPVRNGADEPIDGEPTIPKCAGQE
jgi:hypothetical protein